MYAIFDFMIYVFLTACLPCFTATFTVYIMIDILTVVCVCVFINVSISILSVYEWIREGCGSYATYSCHLLLLQVYVTE